MKTSEIRKLTTEDINKKIADNKEELFNLRFRHAIGQLENPASLKNCRKDIAKVMTILRQRELNVKA